MKANIFFSLTQKTADFKGKEGKHTQKVNIRQNDLHRV
jgi:hypothetical protein